MILSNTYGVSRTHSFKGRWRATVLLIIASASAIGMLLSLQTFRVKTPHPDVPSGLSTRPDSKTNPRWLYGRTDARFTVLEYADLECPYCRAYFPVLRQWIDTHPQVNWEWRHLPLTVHDPAATREARLAECAGEVGGNRAFWTAVEWIYSHTGGEGSGLPAGEELPGTNRELRACLASTRPDSVVRAHVDDAAAQEIDSTPTLRLLDHQSGQTLTLHGPVEGDSLLSAIDLLAAQ